MDLEQTMAQLRESGFNSIDHITRDEYRDLSTVIVIPSRTTKENPVPVFPQPVVASWQRLTAPMNQKRAMLFVTGQEIGAAYTGVIEAVLRHPEMSKWSYLMTLEDDNIVPADAHLRLLESIVHFDAVAGLYHTKDEKRTPLAFGNPETFERTGELEFRPREAAAFESAATLLPVNGIPMGCTLWRMDLFRETPPPWFVTVNEPTRKVTQDLYACERFMRLGKRFAVDLRVQVGHLDVKTGRVY